MTTSMKDKSFWITETFSGGTEFRTRSKVLLTILSFVFAGLLYQLLIVIEGFPGGSEIIIALAYGVIVLMGSGNLCWQ